MRRLYRSTTTARDGPMHTASKRSLVLYVYLNVVYVVIHLNRVLSYIHRPIGHYITDINEQ